MEQSSIFCRKKMLLLSIPKQVDEFGNGEFEDRQVARVAKFVRIHACATMALLALLAPWRSAVYL